jgi:DNA repair protein RAD5
MFQREGINHLRLDGSLSQKHRQKVLQEFNNPKNACVLLISLKAGGTGLNLTIADHCILLDFWWNAAIENQAIDRIHR